jgi:YVTN family beta-propeller protein
LKDVGKVQVFEARPPFAQLKTLNTGPITNHVNIVRNANGQFAYVTAGGLNEVQVFRTDDFSKVATIPVGKLPHGIWPSGDGTRVYVGLENDDQMIAIDTLTNRVIASIPIGQAPQAVTYVPNAVPGTRASGNEAMSLMDDTANSEGDRLEQLGIAGQVSHVAMAPIDGVVSGKSEPLTNISLFEQGLSQVLQAAVTGLEPRRSYVLALVDRSDGSGKAEPLASFMTNPSGSAIVNALGPIRRVVQGDVNNAKESRRYLIIAPGSMTEIGNPVQIQVP